MCITNRQRRKLLGANLRQGMLWGLFIENPKSLKTIVIKVKGELICVVATCYVGVPAAKPRSQYAPAQKAGRRIKPGFILSPISFYFISNFLHLFDILIEIILRKSCDNSFHLITNGSSSFIIH